MKKYNIPNYIRYKEDLKEIMPEKSFWNEYTRDELITKFLPLVENLARKFSTGQQASGVLSINDLIQIGSEALVKAVDKLEMSRVVPDTSIASFPMFLNKVFFITPLEKSESSASALEFNSSELVIS